MSSRQRRCARHRSSILNPLLDHLDVEAATFVVHDLGGAVGIVAAARRPERVEGLVVTNSFAWPAGRRALRVMLRVIGSRPATGLLGTLRVIPRASRSKIGVGRHYDRADRWRSLFPDASEWIVPGGNQFPMCDDPDGYTRQISDWHARSV